MTDKLKRAEARIRELECHRDQLLVVTETAAKLIDVERAKVTSLESKVARYRTVLRYIAEHDWTSKPSVQDHWKWINDFVDVARKALSGENPA